MNIPKVVTALASFTIVLSNIANADELVSLRLSCSGTYYGYGSGQPVEYTGWFVGFDGSGGAIVQGLDNWGHIPYSYTDENIVFDQPKGCSSIGVGSCKTWGTISRATGHLQFNQIMSDKSSKTILFGECAPFKKLF